MHEPAPAPRRILLGAFGDPGHAFPMLALGGALAGRGHEVLIQTWRRWREDAEGAGMSFTAAPEYQVFPTRERPLKPYAAAVRAARETAPVVAEFAPDACLSDILTIAPALAAELNGVQVATLVPHVLPTTTPGQPPYSIGARLPRTVVGRALWQAAEPLTRVALERGRREYNECRARLGLPPRPGLHTALSRSLTLVATLPQLEYPRDWEGWQRVVGPLIWEPPGEAVEPPPGEGPVVLVAPSTSQDPGHALLRATLAGLADEPVRLIATWNGREPEAPLPAAANAVVVPWLSYTRTMPDCDLVVCHAGHGTVVRALTLGVPVVACPAGGDMAENAARIEWAGTGVRLPRRWLAPATVRLAVRRALADRSLGARARAIATWNRAHGGPGAAVAEVEAWLDRVGSGGEPRRAYPEMEAPRRRP